MERNTPNGEEERSTPPWRQNSSSRFQGQAGAEQPSSRSAPVGPMFNFLQDVAHVMSSAAQHRMEPGPGQIFYGSNGQIIRVNPNNSSPFRVPRIPQRYRPWDTIQRPSVRNFGYQYQAPPPPARNLNLHPATRPAGPTESEFFHQAPPEWPHTIPFGPARFPGYPSSGQQNQGFQRDYYRGPAEPGCRESQSAERRYIGRDLERPPQHQGEVYRRGYTHRVAHNVSGRGNSQRVSQESPPQLVVYPGQQFPQFAQGTSNEAADNFARDFAERFQQDPQRYLGHDNPHRFSRQTTPPQAYINSNVTFYPDYSVNPIPRPAAPVQAEDLSSTNREHRTQIVHSESPDISLELTDAGSSVTGSVTEDEFVTARSNVESVPPSVRSSNNDAEETVVGVLSPIALDTASSLQLDVQSLPKMITTHETPQVTDRFLSSSGVAAQPDIQSFLGLSAPDLAGTSSQENTASALSVQGNSDFVLHLPPLPKNKSRRTELRYRSIPEERLEEVAKTLQVKDKNEPLGRLEDECLCNSCLDKTDDEVTENVVLLMKRMRFRCPRCKLFERMKTYQKMCYVCSRVYNICFNCGKNSVIKARETLNFHSLYRNSSSRLLYFSLPERERRNIMCVVFREWDTAPQNHKMMMARKRLDEILSHIRKSRHNP